MQLTEMINYYVITVYYICFKFHWLEINPTKAAFEHYVNWLQNYNATRIQDPHKNVVNPL